MSQVVGKAIAAKNGFTIHELFRIGEDGNYISCGYGVCNPSGDLLSSFTTLPEAEAELEIVAEPKSKHTP